MLASLLTLVFYCAVKPFETKYDVFVEVFNELNILLISYFALQFMYTSHDPET